MTGEQARVCCAQPRHTRLKRRQGMRVKKQKNGEYTYIHIHPTPPLAMPTLFARIGVNTFAP